VGLFKADCRPLFSHEMTNFFTCKSAIVVIHLQR